MANFDFDPLEFFKEEISNESTADARINAVKNLQCIAYAIGEKRTFEELIPYLNKEIGMNQNADNKENTSALANDDQFLHCMAGEYAKLRDFIPADKVNILIEPLVHLAQQEETVIRDEAISSLCGICEQSAKLVRKQVYDELKSMVSKSEFTTRVSACALFGTVYKIHKGDEAGFKDVRTDLCKAYKDICSDDTPMVRRASANKLFDFVKELEVEDLTSPTFLEAYNNLASEETQDTIRVNIVMTTIEMARKIRDGNMRIEVNKDTCLPVIKNAVKDRSWRVRLTVAKNFDEILLAFGPDIAVLDSTDGLGPPPLIKELYSNGLLQDIEQEVKKEALKGCEKCLKLGETNSNFNNGIQQHLSDIVKQLVEMREDPAPVVRAALAQVLGAVARKLGKDQANTMLRATISDLMKDEFHDVRLNIMSHAGTFCEVLSVDVFVPNLLHTVQSLIMDNHWRIRKTVVEQVPKLAEQFKLDMYQSKLESLFLSSLKDSVFFVRKEALAQLKHIARTFGPDWTGQHLLQKILEIYGSTEPQQQSLTGYASRVTVLQAIPQLWESICSEPNHAKDAIAILIKALRDSVPNVRLCACKVIDELLLINGSPGDSNIKPEHIIARRKDLIDKIKPGLKDCQTDSDSDVQYFAVGAMRRCDQISA